MKDFAKGFYTVRHNMWQYSKPLIILPFNDTKIFTESGLINIYVNEILILTFPCTDGDNFELNTGSDEMVIKVNYPSLTKKIEYTFSHVKNFQRDYFEYFSLVHQVGKFNLHNPKNLLLIPKAAFIFENQFENYKSKFEHLLNENGVFYAVQENSLHAKIWISDKDETFCRKIIRQMK